MKLKIQEQYHTTEIVAKCCITDKFLKYDLILGGGILHKLGIIIYFENTAIV